eukprot:8556070-Alexandrium_andersonii.AAC.1
MRVLSRIHCARRPLRPCLLVPRAHVERRLALRVGVCLSGPTHGRTRAHVLAGGMRKRRCRAPTWRAALSTRSRAASGLEPRSSALPRSRAGQPPVLSPRA